MSASLEAQVESAPKAMPRQQQRPPAPAHELGIALAAERQQVEDRLQQVVGQAVERASAIVPTDLARLFHAPNSRAVGGITDLHAKGKVCPPSV